MEIRKSQLPAKNKGAIEKLRGTVAEQKKRERKNIIDWDALFKEICESDVASISKVTIVKIKNLQKALRKFLKIGEIEMATSIFEILKVSFRKDIVQARW